MNTLLILFFVSLLGISFMVGRKVKLLRRGALEVNGEFPWRVPETHEVRRITVRSLKRYGYVILVISIRSYIKSSDFIKEKYGKLKYRIISNIDKRMHKGVVSEEAKEPSKFLKMVSEYKNKVKEIKDRIREQERTK